MAQQIQLELNSTQRQIVPRTDRSQPPSPNLRGAVSTSRSNSREAKKKSIATFANSKFHVSQRQQRASHFSNRNKYALSEFVGPKLSPQLQVPLECLIVRQKRLEIALTHSKHSLLAFSNRPKIHEVSIHLRPRVSAPAPSGSLATPVLEWGFFHE
jgi:hypothetical protein